MGDDYNFYGGAKYPMDSGSNYGSSTAGFGYNAPASSFGLTTDPRSANQIKAVSDKINTGAKAIEVTGITPDVWEVIPNQHLEEINRLRKLAKIDLTLHGPLVEPTGVSKQGWDESHREQAERQIWSAVERGHKLNPDGNVIVTLHSSQGLPHPETRVINPKTGKEEVKEVWVVDGRTGQFQNVQMKENYLKGIGQEELNKDPYAQVKELNKDNWYRQLSHLDFQVNQGSNFIERAIRKPAETEKGEKNVGPEILLDLYKNQSTEEGKKKMEALGPLATEETKERLLQLTSGEIYMRDSYQELQNLYNLAYDSAKKDNNQKDLDKLEKFRQEIKPKLKSFSDPMKMSEFSEALIQGVETLRSIETPQSFKPLREFAVQESGKTFGNVAFEAYQQFKEHAPIISIENVPAGQGMDRAQDLKDVIEKSRAQFKEKARLSGMSESEADLQSKKLIGATWDVGHINMIRKFGYGDKDLIKETETVAPYLKHIHLSDNFGMEHTELPMGMGNVPIKEHLAKLQEKYGDKLKDIKKIIETGGWYQHFQKSPLPETFSHFGSPVYGMKMAPYWDQQFKSSGGYFAGYGQMLPEGNFSMYGAGFSGLPIELGGQVGGRNRLSGAPME